MQDDTCSLEAPSFSPISYGSSMDTPSPSCVVDMNVSSETAESVSDTQSTTVSKIGSGPIAPLMLLPVFHVPLDSGDQGDRDYGVGGDQGDMPMPNMQPTPISGVCIHAPPVSANCEQSTFDVHTPPVSDVPVPMSDVNVQPIPDVHMPPTSDIDVHASEPVDCNVLSVPVITGKPY